MMRKLVGTPVRGVVVTLSAALAMVILGGILGRAPEPGDSKSAEPAGATIVIDRLEQTIRRAQERLRTVPGDWRTWASLGLAYLERARVTTDPTYYPKAEEAVRRSLTLQPTGNAEALVAQGALANARHDFKAGRRHALAATDANGFNAEAYAVLADAETQLGNTAAATAAVQRMLDLRPGLSAYARAAYDLEQRGRPDEAATLMRRALDVAVDIGDIAFCRGQLGDLAFNAGDLAAADREYVAGLDADPSAVTLQRGRARVAAARGLMDEALTGYAMITNRNPIPSYLLEYAELLRAAGREAEATAQLGLAAAAHRLFTRNGGVDGLTGAALAQATGRPAEALREARGEWSRRRHADVADSMAWSLHLLKRDGEALNFARRAYATGARSARYANHIGMIELALGDTAAAREHLARALRINPWFSPLEAPVARRALAGLGSR
jgi:tetratricopeptide (TPR) repeat protein